MAITVRTPATKPSAKGIPMSSTRKTALVAGVFYLITFISIPTLALYGPVKNHRDWILGSGAHTAVLVGGFLEVIVALACIGTAVTLYPVVKRQNEGVALGFVAARVLEAGMIFTGVVSLLSLVTLRQHLGGAAGANAAALVTTGASHVAIHNWTFLLGQSLTARHQRTAAGLLAVPVPACAPHHSRARTHRSPPAHRRRIRNIVRRHRARLLLGRAHRTPGGCLGAVAWRVAGRQGLQALPDHRCNGRRQHAARRARCRRLALDTTTRPPSQDRPCCRTPTPLSAHRTRFTGRMATAPIMAQSPATADSGGADHSSAVQDKPVRQPCGILPAPRRDTAGAADRWPKATTSITP